MSKKKDDPLIIWPEYFSSDMSRRKGRRVPTSLSVNSPDSKDVFDVAKRLGLSPILEKEKSHPSRWFRSNGRVKVPKKYSKTKTIRIIGKSLVKKKR